MENLIYALISGVFFGLTVFVIKRDLGRLAAKVDELAERQRLCRESVLKDMVPFSFCREHRVETESKIANLFGRIKEVEERTSRINGLMAAERRRTS